MKSVAEVRTAEVRGLRGADLVECRQLPLRLDNHVDDNGYYTYTLREWKRRDWGEGGEEFHWWCTETGEAFVDTARVYQTLRDEIIELVGEEPYALLCAHLEAQGTEQFLPHPAVKRRAAPISVEHTDGV